MAAANGTIFVLDLNGERLMECAASESGVEIRGSWKLPGGTADSMLLRGDMSGHEFEAALSEAGAPAIHSIVAVMPARLEIVRSVSLPAAAPGELEAMIRFEAEEKLPYPEDTWQWSYEKASGESGGVEDIVIYAVRKDAVRNCIELFRDTGIKLLKIYPWTACAAPFIRAGNTGRAAIIIPEDKDISITLTDGLRVRYNRVLLKGESARLPAELGMAIDDFTEHGPGEMSVLLLGNSIDESILRDIGADMETVPLTMDWEGMSRAGVSISADGKLPVAAAISASGARMAAAGNGADLIPRISAQERAARKKKYISYSAAVIAAVLIAAAAVFSIAKSNNYRTIVFSLESRISEMDPRIEKMNAVRAQLTAREAGGHGYSPLDVLKQISEIVPPDRVKITRFFYDRDESIGLSGQAASHEDVMKLIAGMDDTKMFTGTRLDFSREVEEFQLQVVNFELTSAPSVKEDASDTE